MIEVTPLIRRYLPPDIEMKAMCHSWLIDGATMDNSQGLVKGYLTKIQQLSAKHQMGESLESLSPKMGEVIKEAHQHFSLWIHGTPEENWAYFVGHMGFIADLTGDEKYKSSMLHAQGLAKKLSPPTRPAK